MRILVTVTIHIMRKVITDSSCEYLSLNFENYMKVMIKPQRLQEDGNVLMMCLPNRELTLVQACDGVNPASITSIYGIKEMKIKDGFLDLIKR